MTIRPWTTVDVATLRRDYPNTPTRDLAARLDRTERAGYALAMLRELKQRRVPMTRAELAQLVGVDPRNVHRTLDPARRYGVVRMVDQSWEWCA